MKKIIYLIISLSILLLISGCSEKKEINPICENQVNGENFEVDCNTCTCNDGIINCTEKACLNENLTEDPATELQNYIEFNTNLTDFEKEWLNYLENKYPSSKIYHINTVKINCLNCYEVSYKKNREIIKIKVLNNVKNSETTIKNDLEVDIKNENVCKLFQGTWNNCPKLCPTDEVICVTQCADPICEFDYNKITFKKLGEICGGIENGDCEYGLNCKYTSLEDISGTCQTK